MKKIEQEGEPKKTARGKEMVVRNRRPRETVPGHSQEIEARVMKSYKKYRSSIMVCFSHSSYMHLIIDMLLASERSERDTLRSVQSRIVINVYVCVAVIVRMSLLSFDL